MERLGQYLRRQLVHVDVKDVPHLTTHVGRSRGWSDGGLYQPRDGAIEQLPRPVAVLLQGLALWRGKCFGSMRSTTVFANAVQVVAAPCRKNT
jgi:hypothetical protein